ncbi:MAG: hypothetical protein AB1746_02415 [Candidatus Zixiibacteriota bacterium]
MHRNSIHKFFEHIKGAIDQASNERLVSVINDNMWRFKAIIDLMHNERQQAPIKYFCDFINRDNKTPEDIRSNFANLRKNIDASRPINIGKDYSPALISAIAVFISASADL